jgi:hypothetical protein
MASRDKEVRVRITDQFHHKQSMVYELKCDGLRISISMEQASGGGAEWKADGMAKQVGDSPSVSAVGPSRSDALNVLAEAWTQKGEANGFPRLDWNAVREALLAVRAI